jgi:serine/threonine protein kinase
VIRACRKTLLEWNWIDWIRLYGQITRSTSSLDVSFLTPTITRLCIPVLLVSEKEDEIHVKLCDFGLVRPHFDHELESEGDTTDEEEGLASPSPVVTPGRVERSYSIVGSDFYTAPEVGFSQRYSPAIDVYSLGVTVYILLCGFPPIFAGDDDSEVVFPSSYWNDISPEAKALVAKMLQPNPLYRIGANDALSDPWINRNKAKAPTTMQSLRSTNLDLVCRRLYTTVAAEAAAQCKKRSCSIVSAQSPRRTRARSSSVVLALADICRGLSAVPHDTGELPFLAANSMMMQSSMSTDLYESDSEDPVSCLANPASVAAL